MPSLFKRLAKMRTLPVYVFCIVVAAAYTTWFWWTYYVATPVETYHRAWQATKDAIYSPEILSNWNLWEHKFDAEIRTIDDAVRCGNIMLKSLHDKYTVLLDAQSISKQEDAEHGQFKGIGIAFNLVEPADGGSPAADAAPVPTHDGEGYPIIDTIMPHGPAEKAGIKPGDALTAVSKLSTKDKNMEELLKILRSGGPTFSISVRRGKQDMTFTVSPALVPIDVVTWKKIDDKIGYISLRDFLDASVVQKFSGALERLSAQECLILDLRRNSGGRTDYCLSIASLLMDKGNLVTIKNRILEDGYNTSTFVLAPEYIEVTAINESTGKASHTSAVRQRNRWPGKGLVILTDKWTASSAELLAAALRENDRAIIFGARTMGKGIAQTQVSLPNNVRLHITSARYFTPKGHWLGDGGNSQSHGINPDFPIKSTGREKDPVLEAAVQYLKKGFTAVPVPLPN